MSRNSPQIILEALRDRDEDKGKGKRTETFTVPASDVFLTAKTSAATLEKNLEEICTAKKNYAELQKSYAACKKGKIKLQKQMAFEKQRICDLCFDCLKNLTLSDECSREHLADLISTLKTMGKKKFTEILNFLISTGKQYLPEFQKTSIPLYRDALNNFTKAVRALEIEHAITFTTEKETAEASETISTAETQEHAASASKNKSKRKRRHGKKSAGETTTDNQKNTMVCPTITIDTDKIDPTIVADLFYTIGRTHFDLEQYPEALTSLHLALDIRQQRYGENSGEFVDVLNDIANVLYEQKNYAEATSFYERAKQTLATLGLTREQQMADTLHNMGNIYLAQKEYEQAEKFFMQALQLEIKLHGENSPETIETRHNLGQTLYESLKFEEALVHYEKAREIAESNDNPKITTVLTGIAVIHLSNNNYQAAWDAYEQILKAGAKYQLTDDDSDLKIAREGMKKIYAKIHPETPTVTPQT